MNIADLLLILGVSALSHNWSPEIRNVYGFCCIASVIVIGILK